MAASGGRHDELSDVQSQVSARCVRRARSIMADEVHRMNQKLWPISNDVLPANEANSFRLPVVAIRSWSVKPV